MEDEEAGTRLPEERQPGERRRARGRGGGCRKPGESRRATARGNWGRERERGEGKLRERGGRERSPSARGEVPPVARRLQGGGEPVAVVGRREGQQGMRRGFGFLLTSIKSDRAAGIRI